MHPILGPSYLVEMGPRICTVDHQKELGIHGNSQAKVAWRKLKIPYNKIIMGNLLTGWVTLCTRYLGLHICWG